MTRRLLAFRSLAYYWRTNLAVVGGMATAVAVLGGALVVGDSVRGTLYDLALERLGHTRFVVTSPRWFREDLAAEIGADPTFHPRYDDVCPLVAVPGAVTARPAGAARAPCWSTASTSASGAFMVPERPPAPATARRS